MKIILASVLLASFTSQALATNYVPVKKAFEAAEKDFAQKARALKAAKTNEARALEKFNAAHLPETKEGAEYFSKEIETPKIKEITDSLKVKNADAGSWYDGGILSKQKLYSTAWPVEGTDPVLKKNVTYIKDPNGRWRLNASVSPINSKSFERDLVIADVDDTSKASVTLNASVRVPPANFTLNPSTSGIVLDGSRSPSFKVHAPKGEAILDVQIERNGDRTFVTLVSERKEGSKEVISQQTYEVSSAQDKSLYQGRKHGEVVVLNAGEHAPKGVGNTTGDISRNAAVMK